MFYNASLIAVAQARDGVLVATHRRVRLITPAGAVRTLAGNGRGGEPGDGTRAAHAPLEPRGIAALRDGGFVVSTFGGTLLRIGRDGRVRVLAAGLGAQLGGVATDADGGIVYADGARVRYIAPRHPRRLAVAVAGVRGGRVRAEATRGARIRLELWRGRRRLAAGASVTAPHGRGAYRVRAVARAGRAHASAQGVIVLGGKLSSEVAGAALIPGSLLGVSARTADPPGPFRELAGCRRHGPRRLDCEIDVGEDYSVSCTSRGEVLLGRDALVRVRESSCMKHPLRGRAHWLAPFAVAPLM
jgi:hypothetical protein